MEFVAAAAREGSGLNWMQGSGGNADDCGVRTTEMGKAETEGNTASILRPSRASTFKRRRMGLRCRDKNLLIANLLSLLAQPHFSVIWKNEQRFTGHISPSFGALEAWLLWPSQAHRRQIEEEAALAVAKKSFDGGRAWRLITTFSSQWQPPSSQNLSHETCCR